MVKFQIPATANQHILLMGQESAHRKYAWAIKTKVLDNNLVITR